MDRIGVNMKLLAGATKEDILDAMNITKVVTFIKRDEEIEGVRATGVFEPVLLSREEIAVDTSKDGSTECHSNGVYLPCEQ